MEEKSAFGHISLPFEPHGGKDLYDISVSTTLYNTENQ